MYEQGCSGHRGRGGWEGTQLGRWEEQPGGAHHNTVAVGLWLGGAEEERSQEERGLHSIHPRLLSSRTEEQDGGLWLGVALHTDTGEMT